ncbi:probable ubiquitin-like-specific protease 2A isoform X4 [Mangifera indica]|uniref:probable ubiquitin-like-specific protease 2A isoform X4 n=1 Tax=Mangifera indica TaxID=29780 RepID=UPI001CF92F4E|nr:probable ubiquitin-like-specific protease 2A isoform X4 [Mangifera indica]
MKKKKYQVFDFNDEDERVEKISKKFLGKFSPKNNHTSPVDKYKFLQCSAQSAKSEEMEINNKPIVVDDGVAQGENSHQKEIMEKLLDVGDSCMDNHCTYSLSYLKGNPRKDCTLREATGLNTSLLSCSSDYENEQVSVISDDDDCIEMSSSISSSPPDNEEELVAGQSFCGHEIDLVKKKVIVSPDFILYKEIYCTNARITFSCSSIKVEGSTVNGNNGTLSFECNVGDIIKIQSAWHGRVETAIINLTLKSNDSIGAEKADEISGIQLLKFAVYDPDWSIRQEAIKLLDVRYEEVWDVVFDCDRENEVNTFLGKKKKVSDQYLFEFDEHFEDVIYPKGDPDAVVISKKDIELLRPETFINDTIIDFYIQYLKKKLQPEEQHRFHFFNSFFFRKLADLDKDPSGACEGKAAFQRVRKWTKNVNLFEKDYVFIPVNYSLHWSLIVICHPGEVAYFKDDEIEKSTKVPCILHMDSIKGSHRGLKDLLQSYLCEEWKEKHNSTGDEVPSKILQLRFVPLELPQQENSFDCGLFLLHYAELFIAEAPPSFNPFKITGFSTFLKRNWFPPMEASLNRAHIKMLIYELSENHSNKDPSADGIDEICPSSTLSPDEDGQETGAVIVGQISTPTKNFPQGYSSTSNVGRGIETPLIGALPLRVAQGHSDPGLVSLEHCEQITACYPKNILSPIEEVEETSDEKAKASSNVEQCQKVLGLAAKSSTSNICIDGVSQMTSCDWRCLLHFEKQDECTSEHQNISKENIDENQLPEVYEVPSHGETNTVKPEDSPSCRGKFVTFLVEDSEEENNALFDLVIEDSQEENGVAALVVEDSEEICCTQNACKNKDTGSSNSGNCTLTHQEADLTEIIHIKEDKMPIRDEDRVSKRVAKKLRLEISDDGEEHLPKQVLSCGVK